MRLVYRNEMHAGDGTTLQGFLGPQAQSHSAYVLPSSACELLGPPGMAGSRVNGEMLSGLCLLNFPAHSVREA